MTFVSTRKPVTTSMTFKTHAPAITQTYAAQKYQE